jgi:hypothetical protein
VKFIKVIIVVLACQLLVGHANAVNVLTNPKFAAIDTDGNPLVGGCLYSFDCGTSNKSATCADDTCSSFNPNPVTLDSRGEADIFIQTCVKLSLYEADTDGTCDLNPTTSLIWTKDNISTADVLAADGSVVLDYGTDGTDATFTGDILADDGTEVLENGTNGTDASFIGSLTTTSIVFDGFTLSIEGWNISVAAYDSKSVDVSSEETSNAGVFFKADGLKMYVVGFATDAVYQYTLSTAWDVSTASYASLTKDVSAEDVTPHDVFFSSDGTAMYIAGISTGKVYQYGLSTPWDVSTATYAGKNKDVSAEDVPEGLFFSPDGTTMYMCGQATFFVYQYTLSTPWDVSTAVYASKSKNVSTEELVPKNIFFSVDGIYMYVVGNLHTVFQYELSTAYDVSTATYTSLAKNIAEDDNTEGLFFKPDGTKLFMSGYQNNKVYQYVTGFVRAQQ